MPLYVTQVVQLFSCKVTLQLKLKVTWSALGPTSAETARTWGDAMNSGSDVDDGISSGRLFQTAGAAATEAQSQ